MMKTDDSKLIKISLMAAKYIRGNKESKQSEAARLVIFLIRYYQIFYSRYANGICKYTPSCSNYSLEALKNYGVIRGGILALRRLLRCSPSFLGGYDPVP